MNKSGSGLMPRLGIGLLMGVVIVWSFFVPELPNFQSPELARILFWHVPCPAIASILLGFSAFYSWRYLVTKDLRQDLKAIATIELGAIFCILTMLTGLIFSKVQWGAWWQNDPRQTSFLMVLMIYLAYFALRGAFPDRDRKAAYAGGYALAAILPVLFLIYVYPRLPQVDNISFHPTQSIMSGQIKGSYGEVLLATHLIIGTVTVWLIRMRVSAGELELKAYESLGLETHRHGPAAPVVVRAVRVPADSGSESAEGSSQDEGA